ncbi:hypothetical protein [Intestinibacter sp.]
MNNIYNIIDINFLIEAPFQYKEDECFDEYKENLIRHKNIKIKFIKYKTQPKLELPILYDKDYIRVYKGEKGFIREYRGVFENISHGCLFELSDDNTYYEYHYYTNPKETLPTISNIFEKSGFEHILYKENTFILHSSYIKYKNKAILFSAPSGTGKSTQANLWEKYMGAEIINGDRTAINVNNGRWCAYGIPFAGSSNIYKNVTTPIKSIVILRQSKENSIRKLNKLEAFKYIYSETTVNTWNKDYVNTIINLIMDMLEYIDVYMLSCRPDKEAVDLLKREIEGDESNE